MAAKMDSNGIALNVDNVIDQVPEKQSRTESEKIVASSMSNSNHMYSIHHNYHDHSQDTMCDSFMSQLEHTNVEVSLSIRKKVKAKNNEDDANNKRDWLRLAVGVIVSFPVKLHIVLSDAEDNGFAHMISWYVCVIA